MNQRFALPTAGGLILALSAAFVPFMKHNVDAGLAGAAKAALASKGVTGVAVSSDWARLTLKGQASRQTSALAATRGMDNAGVVNTVTFVSTDAARPSPAPSAPSRPKASDGAGASNLNAEIGQALGEEGVSFGTASAALTPQGKTVLDHVATLLGQAPGIRMTVAGYTDNQGQSASNRSLSLARAKSALSYLAAHGVAVSRMTAAGYGDAHPVATNATAAGRAANRRIVFTVQGG